MINDKINIDVITDMLSKIPPEMDIVSIDLSNNTYKINIALEHREYMKDNYNSSLNVLMKQIKAINHK